MVDLVEVQHPRDDLVELAVVEDLLSVVAHDALPAVVHGDQARMETMVAIDALLDGLPDLLLDPAAPYPSINGMLGDAVQREDRVGGLLGDETRKPG